MTYKQKCAVKVFQIKHENYFEPNTSQSYSFQNTRIGHIFENSMD